MTTVHQILEQWRRQTCWNTKTCIQDGSSNLSHFPLPFQQSFLGQGGSGRFWQRDLTMLLEDDLSWESLQPLIQGALVHQAVHGRGGQWRLLLILDQSRKQGVACPVQFFVHLLLDTPSVSGCPKGMSVESKYTDRASWSRGRTFLSRDLGVALKIGLEVRWLFRQGSGFRDGDWERSRIPQI